MNCRCKNEDKIHPITAFFKNTFLNNKEKKIINKDVYTSIQFRNSLCNQNAHIILYA